MNRTLKTTLFIAIFAIAVFRNEGVFSQQPSFWQLRQEIKPAADIMLDWHYAQTESIDETRQQIVANQERIAREQENRALAAQRAIDLERERQEDNDRQAALSDVQRFDVELQNAVLNLQDPRLRREAQNIQTAVKGLLNSRASASQIQDTLKSQQDNLKSIRDHQTALNAVQTFRTELASVQSTLQDRQLIREARNIETELNRLTSQTPASQIQDSLRVQRSSLQSIRDRQKDIDDLAAAIALQKALDRQAEIDYWNSPEGRAEAAKRAAEAAERRRLEQLMKQQRQEYWRRQLDRFLRNAFR